MTAVRMMVVLLVVAGGVLLFGCSRSEQAATEEHTHAAPDLAQKLCPVMGMPIDQSVFVDYEGQRVYFCCTDCVETFLASPEKYLDKTDAPAPEDTGSEPAEAVTQTSCPVMDMPINQAVYVEHEGRRVYFCCEDCIETFKQDPQKHVQKLGT
jgi:YHS domain-containing protein